MRSRRCASSTLRRRSVSAVLGSDPDAATFRQTAWVRATGVLPPSERAVVLGSDQQLTARDSLEGLAADDGRAVALGDIADDPGYGDWTELLWSPATGSHAEPSLACHDDVSGLTVAADRLAYLCGVATAGFDGGDVEVYLASFGQTDAPNPAFSVPCCHVTLAGSGSLLAAGE